MGYFKCGKRSENVVQLVQLVKVTTSDHLPSPVAFS